MFACPRPVILGGTYIIKNYYLTIMNIFRTRYSLLASFIIWFLSFSLLLRIVFTILSWKHAGLSFFDLLSVFGKGFLFDLAVALFFTVAYSIYLLLLPSKWSASLANRIITYSGVFLAILIAMFSFFAEVIFWLEFDSRFNFIAVDYLIYTYEVVNNINQSYPLPYLIGGMLLGTTGIIYFFQKQKVFAATFYGNSKFKYRSFYTGIILILTVFASFLLSNGWADKNHNRYSDELSKAGIFSFFAAFKSNELDYEKFYITERSQDLIPAVKKELAEPASLFQVNNSSILRKIKDSLTAKKPNVIMITIESFSADFMQHFGNDQSLTPVLDSIASQSILFTDMYATGTRTVRGMEALSLAIPPTPGNSIVRRANNDNLFCIGTVFKSQGYSRTFFYGGDGYFDNMNNFFGNNGFNIVDRGSKLAPGERIDGVRTRITDDKVHFENAWGICDEDLYDAVIRDADRQYANNQLFYNFVMTTSNHRPYTYPAGKIDIAPGSGRNGAVKYTDYAIGEFLKKIKSKPWFNNTVIIFVADHCASVAGKEEIDVANYHIPCIIYNLPGAVPSTIDVQCSQIDLYPTLFNLLHWSYESNFYGKNVLGANYRPRAFVGTYQKLGLLSGDKLLVLSPGLQASEYVWDKKNNTQTGKPLDKDLLNAAISYYQSAYYLFKTGGLKDPGYISKYAVAD